MRTMRKILLFYYSTEKIFHYIWKNSTVNSHAVIEYCTNDGINAQFLAFSLLCLATKNY